MGIQLNGITGDITAPGISSASNFQTGSSNLHQTGLDLGTGNITGHNLHSTGIVTATEFHGDGSNLTGVSGF